MRVDKVDNYTYTVTGISQGSTGIVFGVYKDGMLIQCVKQVYVSEAVYGQMIYCDGVEKVNVGDKTKVRVTIYPEGYNCDTNGVAQNPNIATLTKIDSQHYEITALQTGTAKFKFTAQSSLNRTIEVVHTLTILLLYTYHKYPSTFLCPISVSNCMYSCT